MKKGEKTMTLFYFSGQMVNIRVAKPREENMPLARSIGGCQRKRIRERERERNVEIFGDKCKGTGIFLAAAHYSLVCLMT
jgi:hypothetical protein